MASSTSEQAAGAFVGRRAERASLVRALDGAAAGGPSRVWVEGPAGSTKTTPVRRALDDLPAGAVTATAHSDELASDAPDHLAQELGARGTDGGFGIGQGLLG